MCIRHVQWIPCTKGGKGKLVLVVSDKHVQGIISKACTQQNEVVLAQTNKFNAASKKAHYAVCRHTQGNVMLWCVRQCDALVCEAT
eukprot:1150862-Pelagomonas_calceolata.AAC.3